MNNLFNYSYMLHMRNAKQERIRLNEKVKLEWKKEMRIIKTDSKRNRGRK